MHNTWYIILNIHYQIKKFIGNYPDINNVEIKNKMTSNYYHNVKTTKNNINYEQNKNLSISYNQIKDKNHNFYPKKNENKLHPNKIIKIPLSYINANINTKSIELKNPKGLAPIKHFNFWNISPFKKRNNQNQANNKKNNRINSDNNNLKTSQLMDEINKFNKQYNINIKKNDKNLMKNKMIKIKSPQLIKTNQSADNNKLFRLKNKNNHEKCDDKNCNIF